jgi:hypothetical protein
MNLFLRAVQPEMNDVFLCSLVLVNMLASLQIFQVRPYTLLCIVMNIIITACSMLKEM